jgi:hypothetical protein
LRKLTVLWLLVFLVGCSTPSPDPAEQTSAPTTHGEPSSAGAASPKVSAESPQQAPISYDEFSQMKQEIFHALKPKGFSLFGNSPNDVEIYGFDADLAWGKRTKTVVANDDSKPSQFRYTFVTAQNDVAVVVQFMYTEVAGQKDVIGFMNIPAEEAELGGKTVQIVPPPESMELFMYNNVIVWLRAFPVQATQAASPELEQRLIDACQVVSRSVRSFLDNRTALSHDSRD